MPVPWEMFAEEVEAEGPWSAYEDEAQPQALDASGNPIEEAPLKLSPQNIPRSPEELAGQTFYQRQEAGIPETPLRIPVAQEESVPSVSAWEPGLWERFRISGPGRALMGPTEAERAGMIGAKPGLLEIPAAMFQMTTPPPQIAQPATAVLEHLGKTGGPIGAVAAGAGKVGLSFASPALPLIPFANLTRAQRLGIAATVTGPYIEQLPEQSTNIARAIENGDVNKAIEIATETGLNGVVAALAPLTAIPKTRPRITPTERIPDAIPQREATSVPVGETPGSRPQVGAQVREQAPQASQAQVPQGEVLLKRVLEAKTPEEFTALGEPTAEQITLGKSVNTIEEVKSLKTEAERLSAEAKSKIREAAYAKQADATRLRNEATLLKSKANRLNEAYETATEGKYAKTREPEYEPKFRTDEQGNIQRRMPTEVESALSDFKETFGDKEIDVVDITDPAHDHFGEPFWMDSKGRIQVNSNGMEAWINRIGPEGAKNLKAYAETGLIHEGIHVKGVLAAIEKGMNPDQFHADYYKNASAVEKTAANRSYYGKWGRQGSDAVLGAEMLRRNVERLKGLDVTEIVQNRHNYKEWLTQKFLDYVERGVGGMRKAIGTKASARQRAMVESVLDQYQNKIDAARKAMGYESEALRMKSKAEESDPIKRAREIAGMDNSEFAKIVNFTGEAELRVGDKLKTKAEIEELIKLSVEAKKQAAALEASKRQAIASKDMNAYAGIVDEIQRINGKQQYFNEAVEWAYGNPGKVRFYKETKPDYKPTVPMTPEEVAALYKKHSEQAVSEPLRMEPKKEGEREPLPSGQLIRTKDGMEATIEKDTGGDTITVMRPSGKTETIPASEVWWYVVNPPTTPPSPPTPPTGQPPAAPATPTPPPPTPAGSGVAELSRLYTGGIRGVTDKVLNALRNRGRITDDPNIRVAVADKDIMFGREWVNSPEYLLARHPEAFDYSLRLTDAVLKLNSEAQRDVTHFNELIRKTTPEQQKQITEALRKNQKGNNAALNALPAELRTIADEHIKYMDEWRKRIQERKVDDLIESMPDARGQALRDILNGVPQDQAFKAHRLKAPGKKAVTDALSEVSQLRKWGHQNYITNAEMGAYRIVDKSGNTVAIAQTRTGAIEKAKAYIEKNGAQELTITDEFDTGNPPPQGMSGAQYWRMVREAKKQLNLTAQQANQAVRAIMPNAFIKPSSKYNRFLRQRRDILKGEENVFEILPSYIYSMWKKFELDPLLKEARGGLLESLPENVRSTVDSMIVDAKGRKYPADKIVDSLMGVFGAEPMGASRATSTLHNAFAALKLGYRPISALVNRLGGMTHTWTKAGTRNLIEGRKFMRTQAGKDLFNNFEAETGLTATLARSGRMAGKESIYDPLWLFQKQEKYNRAEALGSFYQQAVRDLKLPHEEAVRYATGATRFAEFCYASVALPKSFRGPVPRTVLMFKSYLAKEMEFLSTLKPAEAARYAVAFVAMGGPRAANIMIKSIPILGAMGIWSAIDDYLSQEAPEASRGVPGFAGVDISPSVAPQLPSTATDWAGPIVGDIIKLGRDVIIPALQGREGVGKDIKNWLINLAPASRYVSWMVESAKSGKITDQRGLVKYEPTKPDIAKYAVGATPLRQSIESAQAQFLRDKERKDRDNRANYVEDIANAIEDGDSEKMRALIPLSRDYGFKKLDDLKKSVNEKLKKRQKPQLQRALDSMMKANREKEVQRLNP